MLEEGGRLSPGSHVTRPKLRDRSLATSLLLTGLLALPACDSGGITGPDPPAQSADWPESEALETLRAHLHDDGSGAEAFELFPDLTPIHVDDGHGKPYYAQILPFTYYWSPSGRFTVSICAIHRTVFICPFHLARLITPGDFPRCDVEPGYAGMEVGGPP